MNRQRYRCVVVDDEALGRELIATHLNQLDQFELVASCASAIEASKVLQWETVDLLFLDIEMPVLRGTDFYQSLLHKPKVIFTTAYRDYAVDGFELEAVDYLLKPIVFARFFKAIERFLAAQNNLAAKDKTVAAPSVEFIFVRVNRKNVRLVLADVLFVQSLKDYVQVHTINGVFTVKDSISNFTERLSPDFVRVHRSYVVNRRRISVVSRHDVEIGDVEIPISDSYRDSAFEKLGVR